MAVLLLLAATFVAAIPSLNPFTDGTGAQEAEQESPTDGPLVELGPYFSDLEGNEASPERIIELLRCTLIRSVPAYEGEDCVIDGEVVPVESAPVVFQSAAEIRAEFQRAVCDGPSAIPATDAICSEQFLTDVANDPPVPTDLPALPQPPSLVIPADGHTLLEQVINLIEEAEHVPVDLFCETVFPEIEDLANDDVFGGSPPPTGECKEEDDGHWTYERPSMDELGEWAPDPDIDPGDIDPSDQYTLIDELNQITQLAVIQPAFETICNTLHSVWGEGLLAGYEFYCTDKIAGPDGEPIDFQIREECRAREEHDDYSCAGTKDWNYDRSIEDEELTILDRDGDENADAWRIQVVCTEYVLDRNQWDEDCQFDTQTSGARHHCLSSDFIWGGSENHTGMLVTAATCAMRVTGAIWVIDEENDRVHFEVYNGFDDRLLHNRLTFDAFNDDQELIVLQILDEYRKEDPANSERYIHTDENFWPNPVCNQIDPPDPEDQGGSGALPSTMRTIWDTVGYEDRACNTGWEAPTDLGWLVLTNPLDLDGDGTSNINEITGVEDEQDPGQWTDWLGQFDPSDPRFDDLVAMTLRTSNPFNFMATPFNPLGDPCVVPEGEINPCIMPVDKVDVEFTQVQDGIGELDDEKFPYTVWGTVDVEYEVVPINELVEDPAAGVEYNSWRIFENSDPVPGDPVKQSDICSSTGSFRITDPIDFSCTGEEAWVLGNDRARYLFLELCAAPDPVYGEDHLPEICVRNIPEGKGPDQLPPFDPPQDVLWDASLWESRVPDPEDLVTPGIVVHVWNRPAVQIVDWIPYGFPSTQPAYWPDEVKNDETVDWGSDCDRPDSTSNSQTDWHCGFTEFVVTVYHPTEDIDYIRSQMCFVYPNPSSNNPPTSSVCRNFDWPELRRGAHSEAHLLEPISKFEGSRSSGTYVFLHDTRDYPHPREQSTHEDATSQGRGIKIRTDAEIDSLEEKANEADWLPEGEGRNPNSDLCGGNTCQIRVFHNEPPTLSSIDSRILDPADDTVVDLVLPSDDNPTDGRAVAFEFTYRDRDRNPFAAPSEVKIEIFDEKEELVHTVTDDSPFTRDWPESPCRYIGSGAAIWHLGEPMQCVWDFKDEDGELVDAATITWQLSVSDADEGDNTGISDLLDLNIVPLPELLDGAHETEPLPTYFGDHRVDFQVTYEGHNFAPGQDEEGNETVYVELERLDGGGGEIETRTVQMERCRVQTTIESESHAVFCAERELFPDGSEWQYWFFAENERGREAYDIARDGPGHQLVLDTACMIAGAPVTEYCHGYDELLREQAQDLQDEATTLFWGPIDAFNEQNVPAPWGTDVCLTGTGDPGICLYPDQDGDLVPNLVEEWLVQTEVVNTMNGAESEPVFQFYEDIRIAVCQPDTSSLPLPRECDFPLVEITLSQEDGGNTLSVCTDDGDCHIEGVTVHVVDFQVSLLGFEIHAFAEDGEEVFFLLADGTRAGSGSSPVLSFGAQTIDHSISASVLTNPIDVCLEGTGGFSSLDDRCVYPESAPGVGIAPQADGSFCLLRYPLGSGQPDEVCPLVLSADDIPDVPDVPDPEQETANLICGSFEPEGCEEGEDGNWTYEPTPPEVLDPTNPNEVFGAIGQNEDLNCDSHSNWGNWLSQMIWDPDCQYT